MSDKPTVCEHGSLKRVCLTCELEEEIAELKAEVERLNTLKKCSCCDAWADESGQSAIPPNRIGTTVTTSEPKP